MTRAFALVRGLSSEELERAVPEEPPAFVATEDVPVDPHELARRLWEVDQLLCCMMEWDQVATYWAQRLAGQELPGFLQRIDVGRPDDLWASPPSLRTSPAVGPSPSAAGPPSSSRISSSQPSPLGLTPPLLPHDSVTAPALGSKRSIQDLESASPPESPRPAPALVSQFGSGLRLVGDLGRPRTSTYERVVAMLQDPPASEKAPGRSSSRTRGRGQALSISPSEPRARGSVSAPVPAPPAPRPKPDNPHKITQADKSKQKAYGPVWKLQHVRKCKRCVEAKCDCYAYAVQMSCVDCTLKKGSCSLLTTLAGFTGA